MFPRERKREMKPKINLKNPLVQAALIDYQERIINALNAEQTVENAIIPIYHLSKNEAKLQQIASGVLVKISNEYFVFSASHVFDQIGDYALCTGNGSDNQVVQLSGERFSSPKGKTGDHSEDVIDASSYHITTELPDGLKERAITLDDFEMSNNNSENCIFLSAGYRITKSNSTKHYIHCKNEAFPSIEIQDTDYNILQLNPEINIALWHEKHMLLNGIWQLSPRPRGFSGGAIIKIVPTKSSGDIVYKQKLVGIITEHRKKTKNIESVIIGTRVGVHLSAIKVFMPHLVFDE